MSLLALGLNHQTAPIGVRERVAFSPDRIGNALQSLIDRCGVHEAAILSTCNRTELYCGLKDQDPQTVIDWWGGYHLLPTKDLQPYLYRHTEQRAVRHILRVASGLDSLILGEPQILGQVKTAYQVANRVGTLGKRLERLFQHTFTVAKQVRTDTHIGQNPVSVAFAAVNLAKQIFDDLPTCTALLIGAGSTIELVARHLHKHQIGRLIIANRTLERAHALVTSLSGYAIALDHIPDHLAEADVVIASTASAGFMLNAAQVRAGLQKRRHRPLLMIDLAVPRDIDPAVADCEDVYLYSVDDLHGMIQENLRTRQAAALQAEDMIDHHVEDFMGWLREQESVASIRALRQQADDLCEAALVRAKQQLAQGKPLDDVLGILARTLTNKLMHPACVGLREAPAQGDRDRLNVIKTLYQLDQQGNHRG